MKRLKDKRLILLITLIATILSILLVFSVLTEAAEGEVSILDRVGKVIYLEETTIIASSHMQGEGHAGIITWQDVQQEEYLLCCQEDGQITGRTTSQRKNRS